jgi:type II secretory pathway component PulM
MVLVTGNWRIWLAGMAASLVMFAVIYFAVIQPSTNTANQAVRTGLQQSQQIINQAKKTLSNGGGQTGAAGSTAQKTLNTAGKLAACVSAAGADPTKLEACQTKY